MATCVAVLGAGSWGTALAVHLSRVGHDVRLWGRDRALVDDMTANRANVVPQLPAPSTATQVAIRRALPAAARCRRAAVRDCRDA